MVRSSECPLFYYKEHERRSNNVEEHANVVNCSEIQKLIMITSKN